MSAPGGPHPAATALVFSPADDIGRMLGDVRRSLAGLGYEHYNPIMSLCTLGLPVSPALKLTDFGVDVEKGEVVELVVR